MQGAYPRNWSQKAFTMPVDGFDLHLGTLEMGCRNLAGSPVFGCTAVKGSVYTIEADPGGCRRIGFGFDGKVIDLLTGLKATP